MAAAGVELRERTAFTRLRTAMTRDGGTRVVAVETEDGVTNWARPVDRRPGPARGRSPGRRPYSGRGGPPHGRGPRTAPGLRRQHDADGLRHGEGPSTGVSRRAASCSAGATRPSTWARHAPSTGSSTRKMRARLAGLVPVDTQPGPAQDLGGDHRLHPGPPADCRAGDCRNPGDSGNRRPDRRRDGRIAGRPRDDVGTGRRPGRGRSGGARHDAVGRRLGARFRRFDASGRSRLATIYSALPFPINMDE